MKSIAIITMTAFLSLPYIASAQDGKNMCLVSSENCEPSLQNDSIQERISRLENEIGKGSGVYTQYELNKLGAKLDDYKKLLTTIVGP